MSSANHSINVNEASREDSGKSTFNLAGNDGQGGTYFKGLQKKRTMSQEHVDKFKDQTPSDSIGSTFAKLTGLAGGNGNIQDK